MSMCALLLAATAAITGPTDNPEDQFRGIWYLGLTEPAVKAFSEFGFNFVFYLKWGFDVKNERLTPDSTARRDRWLDLAEKYGFDVTEALGVLPYDPYLRKTFPQVRADGSTVAYTDMMDPEVKRIVGKLTELNAATIPKDRPRFIGVMPASEVHDPAFPVSKPHLAEAWAAYSGGKPLPDHRNSKTSAHYTKLKDFPASRVIPDDRADFAFYKWFWKHGDGWNDYFTETAHAFDRAAGKRLMTFHDPAIRVPPIWGNGGDVAYLNQWTYIYPEPFNVSFVTACTEAMARGNPGQRVIQMAQAISYRGQLAPIGMKPVDGPEPEWVSREPDAQYITTPPDLMQEAIWTFYSHKIDGILFHGWDSIVDATKYGEKKSGYRYTYDGLQTTISNLFTGVGRELGPLFKALPESGRKIALLESASAWIFAKRGEGGYASGKYSSVALAATLGGLMPYVLYEEEIARDGIPAETEVLLMPFCDVLTETTAKAIKAFQRRGGVVLADENVAPDILPDGALVPFDRAKKAAVDEPVLQKAAQKLKTEVKRFTTLDAETESPDILVRLRRMKSADYLFAINDRRGPGDYVGAWGLVWEKGLPNKGRVSVRRKAGAVYDLARHAAVPFEVKDGQTFVDVEYATNDGRVLLVADKPLAPLEVSVAGGTVTVRTPDAGLMVPIRVERKGAQPFYAVVKDGAWSHDFGAAEEVRVTNLADGTAAGPGPSARRYEATWASLDARPTPQWWTDAKFGIFIHWGPYCVPAYAPADDTKDCLGYAEHYHHRVIEGAKPFVEHDRKYHGSRPYGDYAADFTAEFFDARRWANLFRRAGAKYAVLTSKHHDGFALWPSRATPYFNAQAIGPKRDICREFMDGMKAEGLHAGFYFSHLEYANAAYTNKATRARFIENVNLVQLKELVEDYGAEIVWPDGEWWDSYQDLKSREYLAWLFNESKMRETVVVNDRWGRDPATGRSVRGRHGGHYTTEYGFENGEIADGEKGRSSDVHPWEECRGLGQSFGYNRQERAWHYMSSRECVRLLVRVAAGGGNLLLNVGPDRHGFIPPIMEERLLDMGRWLAVNGEAIYGTKRWRRSPGDGKMSRDDLFFTAKGDVVYAIATKWPQAAVRVAGLERVGSVELVGSDVRLDWTFADGVLSILPPALNPGNVPCDYAWAFRIR